MNERSGHSSRKDLSECSYVNNLNSIGENLAEEKSFILICKKLTRFFENVRK